ncbi:MAG: sorbosone dehydrogenase family protein [Candidatus Altimarinota bacterium]
MKKFLWIILSSFIVAALLLAGLIYYFFGDWLRMMSTLKTPTTPPAMEEPVSNPPSPSTDDAPIPPQDQTGLNLQLPPGFTISTFANNIGAARVLIQDPNGTLIASLTRNGKVVALPDKDQDGKVDEVITVIENLNNPHGLAFRCNAQPEQGPSEICKLYIAETQALHRYDYDPDTLQVSNKTQVVDFPKQAGRHFTRSLLSLPEEDRLLISIGSSCDVCHEQDWRPGKILSSHFDGADYKEYATGLRNSVFMKVHPLTGEVWATEMGRDWLGDDIPPDEVNIIREGNHYGWPTCFGKNIHDTDFDKNTYIRNPCTEPFEQPSYIDLQAHSAPLGLAFFPESWPEEYRYDLLVAYHGSWNRSIPTGYKIGRFELNEQGAVQSEQQDFLTGWIEGSDVTGRPVDILITNTREIFLSDDKGGHIFLIKYFEQ